MRNLTATASVNHEFMDFLDSIDGVEDEFDDIDECFMNTDMYQPRDAADEDFEEEYLGEYALEIL